MNRGHRYSGGILHNPLGLKQRRLFLRFIGKRRRLPTGITSYTEPQSLRSQRGTYMLLLGVNARQHRDIRCRHALRYKPCNPGGDTLGFLLVVIVLGANHARPRTTAGFQTQVVLAFGRSGKNPVRIPHNLRCRAIISAQTDIRSDRREFLGEMQQVITARPGERVDGLRRVPHHADVPVVAQPAGQQTMLKRRNILIFVNGQPSD